MTSRHVRFVSGNPHKVKEAETILARVGVTVAAISAKIDELQTRDEQSLVRDKALKAYELVRAPVFVEHTGLLLAHLNELPGGLTQIFWDSLEADRFAELFGSTANPSVIARTTIGYIDGRQFHRFTGEVKGIVVAHPRGSREFQWDCVFQPEGYTETFAEMGMARKNEVSMRRLALDKFARFLEQRT